MVNFLHGEAQPIAASINARANMQKLGWELAHQEYDEVMNRLGLANWYIRSTDGTQSASDMEATEFVVEQCWTEGEIKSEDSPHCDAMDFLHKQAPESYVRAIYIGHQCEA